MGWFIRLKIFMEQEFYFFLFDEVALKSKLHFIQNEINIARCPMIVMKICFRIS